MTNINILKNLNSAAEKSQVFMGAGREAGFSSKRMTIGKLINESLKNDIKNDTFKKLDGNNKVDAIIDFLNDNDNVEYAHVVNKATIGRDFNSFAKSDLKQLRGLSIVFRMKDNKNIYFKSNSIIFEVDLSRENEQMGIVFKMTNILLMNLPITEHGISRGMKSIKGEFKIQTAPELMKEHDITWMEGLVKPIDLYSDDTSLRIGDWRTITERFMTFNDSRKSLSVPIFSIGEDLKVKKRTKTTFISFVPDNFTLNQKTRYFINNASDNALKGKFKFSKIVEAHDEKIKSGIRENIEFLESQKVIILKEKNDKTEIAKNIEIEINQLEQAILPLKNKVEIFIDEKNQLKNIIAPVESNLKLALENFRDVKKEIDLGAKKLNQEINDYKNTIAKLNNEKTSLNTKLNKQPKKKSKEDKKTLEENTLKIKIKLAENNDLQNDYVLKIKELMDGIDKHKEATVENEKTFKIISSPLKKFISDQEILIVKNAKNTKEINGEIRIFKVKLDSSTLEFNNVQHSIEKDVKEFNQKNDSIKNNIDGIAKIDKLMETHKILKVAGIIDIDDRSKKTLTINSFDADSFILNPAVYSMKAKWLLSDYDYGFAAVIKRNNMAMKKLSFGNYKSPYLAIDLNNPSIGLEIKDKETKGDLNKKQKEAFQMINNSYQSSFLQGPPGTGKTQVISNIVAHYANIGQISLISSSTNEAINNAIERIDRDQKNNPNIIFLRESNSIDQKNKAKPFLEEAIPFNFIRKMASSALNMGGQNELANDVLSSYGEEDINKCIPQVYFEKFFNKEEVNKNIEFFSEMMNQDNLSDEDKKYFWDDNKSKLRRKLSPETESELARKVNDIFRENIDVVVDPSVSTYDFIKQFVKEDKKTILEDLVSKINTKISKEKAVDKSLSADILSTVSEENLINVIGITTTSKPVVSLNGVERELFIDYPVDFSVVDEVSKSITPEIIQISSLSSKFLYAGDYRQLPPAADISSEYISEFFKWNSSQPAHMHFSKILRTHSINTPEEFEVFMKNLYENTLFKNQVVKLKGTSGKKSYTALDTQYRFTSDIAELVNIVYDDEEKLKTHKRPSNYFKDYVIDEANTKSSTVLIDTSYISREYVRFVEANNGRYIPMTGELAFDQKETIFGRKMTYNSLFNQYNAFVGVNTIMKLKNNNKGLKPSDVGYICMTRSQVNVIKELLSLNPVGVNWDISWLEQVKFDTVDNFQGREKDIVLVDLVRAQNVFREGAKAPNEMNKRGLEHYSRNERLNVAVSRAKSKLILIGSIEQHLGPNVTSKIEKNGSTQSIKIFQRYEELINRKGSVIKEWMK